MTDRNSLSQIACAEMVMARHVAEDTEYTTAYFFSDGTITILQNSIGADGEGRVHLDCEHVRALSSMLSTLGAGR